VTDEAGEIRQLELRHRDDFEASQGWRGRDRRKARQPLHGFHGDGFEMLQRRQTGQGRYIPQPIQCQRLQLGEFRQHGKIRKAGNPQ
jgi:hypothetical protein